MDFKFLVPIGEVAVFYVPVSKLDDIECGDGDTPRSIFKEFLMENYNAFTLEISDTQGCWRKHQDSQLYEDHNARYEVSFDGDEDRILEFVKFLSKMCSLMKEETIYLTMGRKSWLVCPWKEQDEV